MEISQPAYLKRGLPRLININGYDLFYKEPPLKNDLYVFRCCKKIVIISLK